MNALSGIDPERVLERAHEDPAFEAALRIAYRGRHDVLDALWWAAHPLTATPQGVADPAMRLRDLKRAAYARTTDPAEASENQQKLKEAQRQLAEDTEQLADALTAVEQDSAPQSAAATHDEVLEAEHRPRRKLLLPVLSGIALLAAIMLLPTLMQLNEDTDRPPASMPRPAERVQTEIVTISSTGKVADPLAILERPQTDADLPPEGLAFGDNVESYRRLPDLAPHVQLYLARDVEPYGVCLVVVRQDASAMSGCTTAENFAETGLNVGGGNRYELSDSVTILTEWFALLPDGAFQFDATTRMTGDAAFPGAGSVVEPD